MTRRALPLTLLAAMTALAGPSTAQEQVTPTAVAASPGIRLTVTGKLPKPLKLDAAALAELPRKAVRVTDRDGRETDYEGVPLATLIEAAGLGLGPDDLRGEALQYYVVVEAADGYRALFALPELAPGFTDRVVLLADRRDGRPLGGEEGPLRIVVPGEKRQARWVRQVTGLRVGRDGG